MKINIFNKLRKYEKYLFTAYKGDYVRGMTRTEVDELSVIGGELGIVYKHGGCPICLLKFIKKVAKPYFEQKDRLEEKAKEKIKEEIKEEIKDENG